MRSVAPDSKPGRFHDLHDHLAGHMRGRRFWTLNAALAAAVVVLVVFGVTTVFHKASAHAAPRTVTAALGTVQATVSASGNVSPAQVEDLDFSTGGTVSQVDVAVGQHVNAGQVLAGLDPGPAQAALTAAEDDLAAAQDNLALAQAGGETPPQKAADAQALATAGAQVTSDQAALSSAQQKQSADEAACSADAKSPDCQSAGSDQQAVTQAQGALTQAQNALTSEQLSVQAKQYVNPASVLQAEAAVTQAQETVTQDTKTLSETSLTAPFAGTVTALNGSVGETASAGASSAGSGSSASSASGASGSGASGSSGSGTSGSSSAFLTLADMSGLQVVAGFAEADATKIAVGQPGTASLSALPGVTVPVAVTSVSPTSTVVSNVVTYDVTVALADPPSNVKPGMTAQVSVVVASASNVLEVPTSAVTTLGRLSTVTLLKEGRQTTKVVTAGLVGDTTTQITSGLSAGDVVVEPSVTATGSTSTGGGSTNRGLGGLLGGGGIFTGGGGGGRGGGGGG
ncbi:MAG: efflux RND transporter periplasmic adaptor subunit [Acidimicrobiales bacterium]